MRAWKEISPHGAPGKAQPWPNLDYSLRDCEQGAQASCAQTSGLHKLRNDKRALFSATKPYGNVLPGNRQLVPLLCLPGTALGTEQKPSAG